MAIKTATIETNDREKEIFASAHRYTVKIGAHRFDAIDEKIARQVAEDKSEELRRGATLYAVADVCGIEAGALLATYQPRKGWKESDR